MRLLRVNGVKLSRCPIVQVFEGFEKKNEGGFEGFEGKEGLEVFEIEPALLRTDKQCTLRTRSQFLEAKVLEYLEMQHALQKLSAKKLNRKLFNLTKKALDLFHIAELASEINSRRIWCMPQEDLMGKVSLLMHSCMLPGLAARIWDIVPLKLEVKRPPLCGSRQHSSSVVVSPGAGLVLDHDKCMPGSQPGLVVRFVTASGGKEPDYPPPGFEKQVQVKKMPQPQKFY
ncbi:hypothetical protein AK812_SmicGene45887, partial [Symbiodinium microadriaticum]